MNNESFKVNDESQEKPKIDTPSRPEINPENIDESAMWGAIILVGAGAFAAKKFWDWKGDKIKEKASPIIDNTIDEVLKRAQKRFLGTLDNSPNGNTNATIDQFQAAEQNQTSWTEKQKRRDEEKEVFKSGLSDLGIDADKAVIGNERDLITKPFKDKLNKQEERFGALADEDPAFAAEINALSLQEQEDIMSFIRDLDPDIRGKISLAYLSGSMQGNEESVNDINEKNQIFEYVSIEDMTMDEAYDLVGKITGREWELQRNDKDVPKNRRYFEYLRTSFRNSPLVHDENLGEESFIDEVSFASGRRIKRNDEFTEIIKDSLTRYIDENPKVAEELGITNEERIEKDPNEIKMDKMKEEYTRLLKERYTVQKATLRIMSEFLRTKK